jgi:hypothetical protein
MSLNTQGTNLYFIDPDDFSLVTVGCPTSITGFSAPREEREVTCLEDAARSYEAGVLTPGSVSVSLNFDPQDASHLRLHELYNSGQSVDWGIGLSDGTTVPTVDSANEFSFPNDRSFLEFNGYVSDYPFEIALTSNVVSTITIKMSGAPVLAEKIS